MGHAVVVSRLPSPCWPYYDGNIHYFRIVGVQAKRAYGHEPYSIYYKTAQQSVQNPGIFLQCIVIFVHGVLITPEGRPGISDVSPPVWNFRAVIWFRSCSSAQSCDLFDLILFCLLVLSSEFFFQKILQYFSLRDRLLLVWLLYSR